MNIFFEEFKNKVEKLDDLRSLIGATSDPVLKVAIQLDFLDQLVMYIFYDESSSYDDPNKLAIIFKNQKILYFDWIVKSKIDQGQEFYISSFDEFVDQNIDNDCLLLIFHYLYKNSPHFNS